MPHAEQFQRVEDEFYRLKGKYATGRLTEAEFDLALRDLMIQDSGMVHLDPKNLYN